MKMLPDGSYAIEDEVAIDGEGMSPFVFCTGWLLEIVELESGEFYFLSDGAAVRPSGRRFGIFYPAFTIVYLYVQNMRSKTRGVGRAGPIEGLPANPIIFDTDFDDQFSSAGQAREIISSARNVRPIEFNTNPSILSLRAKRLIDENYRVYPSISRIAERLKISHAHLSRQFKRDYRMTPSEYLHHLRTAEATFRLSIGEEIIDISQEVGYNDLSRFYKQFKKQTATSPGVCRAMLEHE